MLLENITFAVSKNNSEAFEVWIKSEIVNFEDWTASVHCYQLMTEIDPESANYSVQFIFDSEQQFEVFKQLHYDLLLAKAQKRFRGEILHFNTLLKKI